MTKLPTGGDWDRDDRPIYFLASSPSVLIKVEESTKYVLLAVNELKTDKDEELLRALLEAGVSVLLDSGVFNLAMEHAALKGITFGEALETPVERLTGYAQLRRKYVDVVERYGGRLWGYIEIDIGGTEQKRATRRAMEAEGLRPIPVYNPLGDPFGYFDELAGQYDRLCIGNIVAQSRYVRLRVLATVAQRARDYPNLWVHLLGLTPSEWLNAFPIQSADSSSWLSAVKWNGYQERSMLRSLGHLPRNFQYQLGDKETWTKGWRMGAFGAYMNTLNWRRYTKDAVEAGVLE